MQQFNQERKLEDESHTSYDSNYFLVIKSITVNFANKSGLLAGATQQQLLNMSMNNGLQMTYYEFSGEGMSNNTDGEVVNVPTIGSIIVIDPAKELGLADQLNMSKGTFAIKCDVTYYNQTKKDITPTIYPFNCQGGCSSGVQKNSSRSK